MCNHRYVANYERASEAIGQRRPYPELYERRALTLPIDERGACIFHSQEIAWKRGNDFPRHFLQLIDLLNTDDALVVCDFAEVVFVGDIPESGSQENVLRIAEMTFSKAAYFTAASFLDSLALDRVEFRQGATFDQATFAQELRVGDTKIHGLSFCHARVAGRALFNEVEFLDYALFMNAHFSGTAFGAVVRFQASRFEGITDFSDAAFILGRESSIGFWQIRFEDFTNFQNTRFQCHVEFDETFFGYVTEFIDTSFESVGSSARYRGSAVELNRIEVPSGAVLTFKSTDAQNKMFTHDVQISFKEDPAGTIRFENVNFSKITPASRLRLTQLAKVGIVQIGPGCIKYRYQTAVRTISISEGNSPLVVELCQTFTNYFMQSNGLNLGFEIVEREKATISFFYFTDEDISEAIFLERLAQTERHLWNLLSGSEHPMLGGESAGERAVGRSSSIINAVDGLSALLGTFFRVGARITLGLWTPADTRTLLTAMRFNDEGAEDRASSLHRVIVEKYTGTTLFGINSRQNALLLPMVVEEARPPATKVRILFLAANSLRAPLDLERDFREIQQSLKHVPNLGLAQEWAVTVDTLTQAMLEAAPTIVHFSGHGLKTGIVLKDARGRDKVVSGAALAELFALFKDSLRCVVLSSCYSEEQARAIRLHVPYVIGMTDRMPDSGAIAFASGFYKAIAAGRDIPFAFKLGIAKIGLEGVSGQNIPVLL